MAKSKDLNGCITPVNESPSLVKPEKEKVKKDLEELMAKEKRLVKGRFSYDEFPGGTFEFKNIKYKGDQPRIKMTDGGVYTIPKWVADAINGIDESKDYYNPDSDKKIPTCQSPTHYYKVEKNEFPHANLDQNMTVPLVGVNYNKPRMRFIPLSFGE